MFLECMIDQSLTHLPTGVIDIIASIERHVFQGIIGQHVHKLARPEDVFALQLIHGKQKTIDTLTVKLFALMCNPSAAVVKKCSQWYQVSIDCMHAMHSA